LATPYATVVLNTVGSTQDEARQRAFVAGEATLVVAQQQVEGRGRSGRVWLEAPRAMYSSLAFRPGWAPEVRPRLTLVAGLAVRRALAALTPTQPDLKWPNDLVTSAGKIGGILTEAEGDWVVIGCGVNLWWPDAPTGIAAACPDDPGPELAENIGNEWAGTVIETVARDPVDWGVEEYRKACVTLDEAIRWEPNGSGVAVDIDAGGGLVVSTAAGRRVLTSGEVALIRPATVAPGSVDDERGEPGERPQG
jgi:BirA family biotin operon repressor/biotin-[acetyl-CoA-carboxylase] ligase